MNSSFYYGVCDGQDSQIDCFNFKPLSINLMIPIKTDGTVRYQLKGFNFFTRKNKTFCFKFVSIAFCCNLFESYIKI